VTVAHFRRRLTGFLFLQYLDNLLFERASSSSVSSALSFYGGYLRVFH
jgi:hypothetical protein